MNIIVSLEASVTQRSITIDLRQLDISEEKWNSLDENDKNERIQNYVDSLPDQPYWVVTTF